MKKVKLNKLAQNAMKEKEMNFVRGGRRCGCGCRYEETGGASTSDNALANYCGCLKSLSDIKVWLVDDRDCDIPCVVL
ncbi:MAG: TIGR04149 family rSAM-modified RiPP [Bacteroidales bacterium]|jgi:natural product precursor|nr:TIGR04149 family rSAM-modified RiPP [Bacteroidales bacterium]